MLSSKPYFIICLFRFLFNNSIFGIVNTNFDFNIVKVRPCKVSKLTGIKSKFGISNIKYTLMEKKVEKKNEENIALRVYFVNKVISFVENETLKPFYFI